MAIKKTARALPPCSLCNSIVYTTLYPTRKIESLTIRQAIEEFGDSDLLTHICDGCLLILQEDEKRYRQEFEDDLPGMLGDDVWSLYYDDDTNDNNSYDDIDDKNSS